MITAEKLRERLSHDIVIVTLTKLNGEVRRLYCTTKPECIPPALYQVEPRLSEEARERVITAYDVRANCWRTFLVNAVTGIE